MDNKLRFYEVSPKYIEYLKQFDYKIPNIVYEDREKFLAGVLFTINGLSYFAPVSSFNKQQKTNFLINAGNYPVGSIRLSFMFPVPDAAVRLKDFSNEKPDYQKLVQLEYRYCNKNRYAIRSKAKDIYQLQKHDSFYQKHCCNFPLLEKKCREWEKTHVVRKKLDNRIHDAEKSMKKKEQNVVKEHKKDYSMSK